jgi:hypothetical protein
MHKRKESQSLHPAGTRIFRGCPKIFTSLKKSIKMNKQTVLRPLIIITGLLSGAFLCVQEAKADPTPSTAGGRVFLTTPDIFFFKASYDYLLNAHGGDSSSGINVSDLFCNNPVFCSSTGAKEYTIGPSILGDGDTTDGSTNPTPEIHGTISDHYGLLKVSEILQSAISGNYYRDWTITAYAKIFPRCDSNFESCDDVSATTNISVQVLQSAAQLGPTKLVSRTDQGLEAVPTPLPILGVTAAFGYGRKLRKHIKSNGNNYNK